MTNFIFVPASTFDQCFVVMASWLLRYLVFVLVLYHHTNPLRLPDNLSPADLDSPILDSACMNELSVHGRVWNT
jgi:hypothetical protein